MKLWLLTAFNADDLGYDTNRGFVIRGVSEAHARALAANSAADEGVDVWENPHKSLCVELSVEGDVGIVISDFYAG